MAANTDGTAELDMMEPVRGEGSPEEVMDAAVKMSPFKTGVSIDQITGSVYVTGRVEKGGFTAFRVHKCPGEDFGDFMGTIGFRRGSIGREPDVRYFPPGDEGSVPVEKISVWKHERNQRLNAVLTALRTELTDTDWAANPGRTNYGEWVQAANTLQRFADDECPQLSLPPGIFQQPEITHAIARYNHDARKVMSSVEVAVERRDDLDFHDVNPEAVRSVLLRYVEEQIK